MKFSIVSYLDKASTASIKEMQTTMSEITGSKACLSSWEPHVTLGDGISVTETELESVEAKIKAIAESTRPMNLKLSGFGYTEAWSGGRDEKTTSYVIWVNVTPGQSLKEVVSAVKQQVTDTCETWYKMPVPYNPHVAIAFRDLDKKGYQAGREYLRDKDFQMSSVINHVALVEKLEDQDLEFRRFEFSE